MGNTPASSGLLQQQQQHPQLHRSPRPFHPASALSRNSSNKNKSALCLVQSFLPHSSVGGASKPTTLQQLILSQDWQRVLIRIDLFPHELRDTVQLRLYDDLNLKVLPVHLACALDPPVQVVRRMVELYVDAAAVPVQTVQSKRKRGGVRGRPWGSRRGRRGHQQHQVQQDKTRRVGWPKRKSGSLAGRWHEWRMQRKGAFPVLPDDEDDADTLLLPKQTLELDRELELSLGQADLMDETPQTPASVYYSVQEQLLNEDADKDGFFHHADHEDEEEDHASSHPSSLSSHLSTDDSLRKQGVILQLSPSGGLQPLAVNSHETESTSENSNSSRHATVFCVHWDLGPLAQQVALGDGQLLALHVACLYQASDQVCQVLVDAYPLAALVDVLGMLPIHWVAAGWTLPTILPRPESIVGLCLPPEKKAGPLPTLMVLRDAVPDSARVASANHALTPALYVEECMEEGDYKEACLRVLASPITDLDDCSLSTAGSLLFVDSSETSSLCFSPSSPVVHDGHVPCITLLLSSKDWSGALAAVEDDPSVAFKWLYGMDDQDLEMSLTVWKRLPIHLACAYGAPVGLLEVLLQAYPAGGTAPDPHYGYLPLHVLCRAAPTLASIRLLLSLCPEATKAVDMQGRLPLHVAILHAAPYTVVEAMVEGDPESVMALDQDGKTPHEYALQSYGSEHMVVELLAMVRIFLQEKFV
jgi:hypothetical protein